MFNLPKLNTQDLPIEIEKIKDLGIFQAGYINPKEISLNQWALEACKKNSCGKYNTNWSCPPALGSLEENEAKIRTYGGGFVFNGLYHLKRDTDFRAMLKGAEDFRDLSYKLKDLLGQSLDDYMVMTVGNCTYCTNCAYPEECRFPSKQIPAVEGMGINVSDLAKKAGLAYSLDSPSIIYLGLVLFNKKPHSKTTR